MQQAIPYKTWKPPAFSTLHGSGGAISLMSKEAADMLDVVSENAVIVFSRKGCCMSHVVRRLLLALGVNPAVYEMEEEEELAVVRKLEAIGNGNGAGDLQLPAVFIGGRLFGGLERIMSTHITGELVPVLKQAGALWL